MHACMVDEGEHFRCSDHCLLAVRLRMMRHTLWRGAVVVACREIWQSNIILSNLLIKNRVMLLHLPHSLDTTIVLGCKSAESVD
jgi:hypothetical protein